MEERMNDSKDWMDDFLTGFGKTTGDPQKFFTKGKNPAEINLMYIRSMEQSIRAMEEQP